MSQEQRDEKIRRLLLEVHLSGESPAVIGKELSSRIAGEYSSEGKALLKAVSNPLFIGSRSIPQWEDKAHRELSAMLDEVSPDMDDETIQGCADSFIQRWLEMLMKPLARFTAPGRLRHENPGRSISADPILDEIFDEEQSSNGEGYQYLIEGQQEKEAAGQSLFPSLSGQDRDRQDRAQARKAVADYLAGRQPDDSQSSTGIGIGLSENKANEKQLQREFLRSIPKSLYRLARLIGRADDSADSDTGRFSRAAKSDINGITVGSNLSALLPSEISLLSDRSTENIFFNKYVGKKLQLFSSASSGPGKKKHQDGPVVITLDVSSSMAGFPLENARIMTLATTIIAKRQHREVLIVKYSDSSSLMKIDCLGRQKRQLVDFLSKVEMGGTNANGMMDWLLDVVLPAMPSFSTADILNISDFGWPTIVKSVQDKIDKAKAEGMRFYGLNIGYQDELGLSGNAMDVLDSVWIYNGHECKEVYRSDNGK